MAEQPTGTVTLLFTDIEGSTVLLERLGADRYAEALDLHRRLLREAFERHGGYEVDYEGDSFFVAFARATDAVEAASEAQQALAQASWPEEGAVRVRMGIHTGEPLAAPPKYVGIDVHKAARIMAAGHGGQVLLSKAALHAAGASAGCIDLGEHRLKDVEQPIWLFQLGDRSFPLLRTISNTNLPRPADSFVGRERELSEVAALIQQSDRLITLSGPGGAGKTRLAIEAGMRQIERFPNGVYWVPLATLRDPALVLPTIAQVVGSSNGLATHISDRRLLLVLDNVEQVLDVAPLLAELIEACPRLHMLVTSRERLRVRGEREYPVATLPVSDAADLFTVRSGLPTDETITELCVRLDRLPLAIELAAARTNLLSPRQILDRLASRLDLLKGGRDTEARHATLRATIAWSHELLSQDEQSLFAGLAVFRGGCTVAAAETVVDADLEGLQSLLDKSLVRRDGERLSMLETVREFASEQLAESRAGTVRERHGLFFLHLAEDVEPRLQGQERAPWLDKLEEERDNLRAALEWAAECADPEIELRLTAALREFWDSRGPLREGLLRLEQAIRRAGASLPDRRLDALRWGALSALHIDEFAKAEKFASEAATLACQLGDTEAEVSALIKLTHATAAQGESGRAHALIEQAVALAQETQEPELLARALINYGALHHREGNPGRAAELVQQAIEVGGDLKPHVRAIALHNLAEARIALGETGTGVTGPLFEVVELAPIHGDLGLLGATLELLATVQVHGDPLKAATLLGAAHALLEQMGEKPDEERAALVLTAGNEEAERAYVLGRGLDPQTTIDLALRRQRQSGANV